MTVQEFMMGALVFAITTPRQQKLMFMLYILIKINQQIQPFWMEISGYINWFFPNMPEMNADDVFILQTFVLGLAGFMYLRYLEDEISKRINIINNGM